MALRPRSSTMVSFTPHSTGGDTDLASQYQEMLKQFGGDPATQQANDLAYLSAQSEHMRNLAKQQSEDWLAVQGKLMSQSAQFRSQESAQQFGQDRQLQGDQIQKERDMQQEQFGQDKRMFLEQERVDNERRNWERGNAVSAYKNF